MATKLKCVVVDDEPLAMMVLVNYLEKIPNIEITSTFTSALPVFDLLQKEQIDILFMDIEMPDITGIDFVRTLTKPPFVVFITANKEYAIEGFELNAVDYLIKPVSLERLLKAVNRVAELKAKQSSVPQQSLSHDDYIFLKENKRNIKVLFKDILYLESVKDYVKVVTHEKTIITKQTLGSFEQLLNPEEFIRIHRSFIIAINHIDAYTCSDIEIGKQQIPIGRNFKDEVLAKLDANSNIKSADE